MVSTLANALAVLTSRSWLGTILVGIQSLFIVAFQFSDQFSNINYVYVSVALDNPKLFTYTDSAGNAVYPATGNLSNEVKVYNNLKNY